MTAEEVEDIRRWSRDECACNHVLNRQGRLSGSELAVNHVIALLAEVDGLRSVISEENQSVLRMRRRRALRLLGTVAGGSQVMTQCKVKMDGSLRTVDDLIRAAYERNSPGFAQHVIDDVRRRMAKAIMPLLTDGRRVVVDWQEENELDKRRYGYRASELEELRNFPTIFRVTCRVTLARPEDAEIGEVICTTAQYEGPPPSEIKWGRVAGGWMRVK